MVAFHPLRTGAFVLLMLVSVVVARSLAQSYEEQARSILALYESGNRDSAYALLEPLKTEARFVPAVLYARAEMTPDDRALTLYKEVIALEAGGAWADRACGALVRRYVDKRDSLAAATWLRILKVNYPRSPLTGVSEELVASTRDWIAFDAGSPGTRRSRGRNDTTHTSRSMRQSDSTRARETYSNSGMRGYALQVGLFPSRSAAERHATTLRAAGIDASPLPKMIDGRKNYALVVGPYATIEEANRRKASVSKACKCQAFTVRVQ